MSDAETVALLKLIDGLQQDLRNLVSETKRKFPQIKDAVEKNIKKLKEMITQDTDVRLNLLESNHDLVQPLLQGCNTKQPKIVIICLTAIQRLATHRALTEETSAATVTVLWSLMEAGIEDLKLLQTAILIITTNSIIKDKHLAKALVICFRLHFTKNSTTINTAAATIRQCASAIFERVLHEDSVVAEVEAVSAAAGNTVIAADSAKYLSEDLEMELLKQGASKAPHSLRDCAKDAFMLFQDMCLLVNGEAPIWLVGLTEMTRTLGLEILESILISYSGIFRKHREFTFLLKERVCPLVIKLFSPSLKFKPGLIPAPGPGEKPNFPMVARLVRLITIIVNNYFCLLNTECEIFLSLLIRFLDTEKPLWQRALALEVLHKFVCQPQLIKHICISYDMKEHSTKIFRELVNALSAFIQGAFINQSNCAGNPSGVKESQGVAPSLVGALPVGAGISPQSAFIYRGYAIPVHMNPKILFYDMLDKAEPANPPDGYCVSLGFLCLLEVVKSVQQILEDERPELQLSDSAAREELVSAAWCGELAALSLLLDASTDENATEAILRAEQSMISLCGILGLTTPRDAFVTAQCKAALPTNYAQTVLSQAAVGAQFRGQSRESGLQAGLPASNCSEEVTNLASGSSQVVVMVGSGLPVVGLPPGVSLGPFMLTAKNIQCMRAILSVAHCHGALLGTAWHLVLTTLQHLVWILGLKVSAGASVSVAGSGCASGGSSTTGSTTTKSVGGDGNVGPAGTPVITSAVVADLPVLSSMLSRLFESSRSMDEVALHHLIDALCKLSSEAMEVAHSNKEPSLFSVAKLLETGLVNIDRIEVWWHPVNAHLLEVCQHPHQTLRHLGADALVALIKEAIHAKHEPPFWQNQKLTSLVLQPLTELSSIPHGDVRQRQLDCVQHILHCFGDNVAGCWLRVIRIIGAIHESFSEQLIRNAFQCFQLIITDYLGSLQADCYPVCVEVAAKFAHQKQDLNIALTAIGSIWHLTDYLYQNADSLRSRLSENTYQELWICVYSRLADLCLDPRPAVRKSGGQTLFNTIDSHGGLLLRDTWKTVLWKVLFPLLESVQVETASAPEERQEKGNLLMHHSRDTAAKQWAETLVLTLSGVANMFVGKQAVLYELDDFPRAWKLLLECLETSALSPNPEISVNALKSVQTLLTIDPQRRKGAANEVWAVAWLTWVRIGVEATQLRFRSGKSPADVTEKSQSQQPSFYPSQAFLTLLFDLFPRLFDQIRARFTPADFTQFSNVLRQALLVPLCAGGPTGIITMGNGYEQVLGAPLILPISYQETNLTPLQATALKNLDRLTQEVLGGPENLRPLLPLLFTQLLTFAGFAVHLPKWSAPGHNGKPSPVEANPTPQAGPPCSTSGNAPATAVPPPSFVTFGERCMTLSVELYEECAELTSVISNSVLEQVIKSLQQPLALKYFCPSQTTWKLASQCFMTVLNIGIPVAKRHGKEFGTLWNTLANTLNDFLFNKQRYPPGLSLEEFQEHEALDCRYVHLVRDQFLSNSSGVPDTFIERMIAMLNQGSIHSVTANNIGDVDTSRSFREEFAQLCFETLLEYSFHEQEGGSSGGLSGWQQPKGSTVSRAAVKAILDRCRSVLVKYVEDERLTGKCPLPRARLSEVSFVLKAMTTLLSTFKNLPDGRIDDVTWGQVIDLYPHTVDCVLVSGGQLMRPLRDVLHHYGALLQPYRQGRRK